VVPDPEGMLAITVGTTPSARAVSQPHTGAGNV
jgi:hypothetical protein